MKEGEGYTFLENLIKNLNTNSRLKRDCSTSDPWKLIINNNHLQFVISINLLTITQ